jgi:DNA-binding beta-propeller fold protein YncE
VTSIFISYRREDEPAAAGRLYDSLVAALGAQSVFIDVDGIKPGADFVDVLEDVLRKCEVLVAVVGRRWLEATDDAGRPRLDDPDDFVRLELVRALGRSEEHGDIRVLPLCVEGARMPRPDEIPADLASFARLQAFSLNHVTWRRDVARLLEWLDAHPPQGGVAARTRRRLGLSSVSRRTRRLAVVIAAISLVGVGAVIALSGGDEPQSIGAIRGAPTPLQGRPTAIAAGAGGIWVTETTGIVEELDPATGRVRGTPIPVEGTPLGLAVGAGAVWVACKLEEADGTVSGSVTAIDPSTRRPLGRPIEVGSEPRDVAIGEGAVWTANFGDGSVSRIEPGTKKAHTYYPRRDADIEGQPADIAVGEGAVWMVQSANQTLQRINPTTGKVLFRIPVPRNPESVVVGAGAVWVASLSKDTVTKIDPKLNAPSGQPVVVGSHPDDMAIWQGALYVAAKDEGLVQRIHPTSLAVSSESLRVGNEPDALAEYRGRLWVANAADSTVVQIAQ